MLYTKRASCQLPLITSFIPHVVVCVNIPWGTAMKGCFYLRRYALVGLLYNPPVSGDIVCICACIRAP